MNRAERLLAGLASCLAPSAAFAQFYNTCNDAAAGTALTPGSHPFDTTGVPPDGDTCREAVGVWFKYTAASAEVLVIDNCGSPDGTSYAFCGKTTCGGSYFFDTSYVHPYPGSWFYYPCPNNPEYFVKAILPLVAGETILVRIGTGSGIGGFVNLTALAPAPNDTCATATAVGPGSYPFNTEAATYSAAEIPNGSCDPGGNFPDVWFQYNPPSSGLSLIKACGTQLPDNFVVAITSGCGAGVTVLDCNEWYQFNSCDNPGFVRSVTAGVPIYIRVSGAWDEALFHGTLSITPPETTPANDNCANASPVTTGTYPFSLIAATTDGSASCRSGTNNDIWFDYDPPSSGLVAINAMMEDGVTPLEFRHALTIFDVDCAGTEVACKFSGSFDGQPASQPLVVSATPGHHLRIRVAAYDGHVGTGALVIAEPQPPVDNDLCANATPVTEGFVIVDNTFATTDTPPWPCGPAFPTDIVKDVWLQYTPSSTGVAQITDCGSGGTPRPALAAYSSCGGASIACNTGFPCESGWGRLVVPVTAGVPVYLRVASQYSIYGGQTLQISHLGAALTNNTCATAQEVFPGMTNFDTTAAVSTGAALCDASRVSVGGELWFKYTAPNDGVARFRHINGTAPHELSIYSACGTVLQCPTNFDQYRNVPMTTGQTVYLRILDAALINSGTAGTGTLDVVDPVPGPSNDTCETAISALADTDYAFDTTLATSGAVSGDLTSLSCGANNPSPDVWYSFTVPGAASQLNEVVFGMCDPNPLPNHSISVFDVCGGSPIDCGANTTSLYNTRLGDGCPSLSNDSRSPVTLYLTGGSTVKVQVSPRISTQPGPGTFRVSSTPVVAWSEYAVGEAGELPASAQVVTGTGPVNRILGRFIDATSRDADVYKIRICDEANFSATTVGTAASVDTRMYLFSSTGHGVTHNDNAPPSGTEQSRLTSAFVNANGDYYLAIVNTNKRPASTGDALIWLSSPNNTERPPDGPGAANPIVGWVIGGGASDLPYGIQLTGVCFIPDCAADFDGNGIREVPDIFAFLSAWFAQAAGADFDGNGTIQVPDIFAFLSAWFAGC